jgi:diaminopimelate epimerase
MPLECIHNFHLSRISNDNVAGMQTLEVGASLAPRACGSGVACRNMAWKSWQI